MPRVATAVVTLLFCFGCKPKLPSNYQGFVIGEGNDIVPLAHDDSFGRAPIAAAVLLATWLDDGQIKFCSGALIEPLKDDRFARVLTNHHCFSVSGSAREGSNDLHKESCTHTRVLFGFTLDRPADAASVGCEEGTLATVREADFATFSISEAPPSHVTPFALWQGDFGKVAQRPALVVHYPHIEEHMAQPSGIRETLPTAAVSANDCSINGHFPPEEWSLDQTLPFSIRHSCDLQHGSSGSALIDVETGQLLGINWGGIKISYGEQEDVYNAAISTEHIQSFLAGNENAFDRQHVIPRGQPQEPAEAVANRSPQIPDADSVKGAATGACAVLSNDAKTDVAWILWWILFLPFLHPPLRGVDDQ